MAIPWRDSAFYTAEIKPSNILVTLHDGVPVPKMIDFAIAKATLGELTDETIHTQFQQFIGTPAYRGPEAFAQTYYLFLTLQQVVCYV